MKIRFQVLPLLFCLAYPGGLIAQGNGAAPLGTGGSHSVQGQIFLPSGRRIDRPVEVRLQVIGGTDLSVIASSDGSFAFPQLSPGNYTVSVDAGRNFEPFQERVFIDSDIDLSRAGFSRSPNPSRRHTVLVHLQSKSAPGSPLEAVVVSAAALTVVPEAARDLYEKALTLDRLGEVKKAVESLNAAIREFPKYPQALSQLGIEYLKLGQPDRAVEPLSQAVRLTPEVFRPNLNLGIALLELKKYEAAEAQLRVALDRNSASPVAHMYLGLALISTRKLSEAQEQLEAAVASKGDEVARAHYYLGGIYWGNRDYQRAVAELETYLRLSPRAPDADKVRATVAELRKKQ